MRVPAPAGSSQMRPPWASTMAREMARPRPAPSSPRRRRRRGRRRRRRARRRPAEHPLAVVGDLDLDPAAGGSRPHGDAAVGGGVADRVLDQVEEDALDLLGVGLGEDLAGRQLGGDPHPPLPPPAPASPPRCRRSDRPARPGASSRRCHRPRSARARRGRRSSPLRTATWVRISRQVAVAGLPRRHPVVDRLDQQPQRGQRRAQVVRGGGDEPAARLLDLPPRALLHRQANGERGGQGGAERGEPDQGHLRDPHPVRDGDRGGAGEEGGDGDDDGALHGLNL